MSEDDEKIDFNVKRKRKHNEGPKRKRSKPNIASQCPTCGVKANIRKKRPEMEIIICDSCDLPVPQSEPLFECSALCDRKDLCGQCANGKTKRAKKRKKLSIIQKFGSFDLALMADGALAGEDLDFLKMGTKQQRELTERTRLKIATLSLPKRLAKVSEAKQNLVRSILMEFHVRQCKSDDTISYDKSSRWCIIRGWNIPGVEIKGETQVIGNEDDLASTQEQCINDQCFAFQVENGKARLLNVQWGNVWPNMKPAHESSDVVLYIAPHDAKPKPKHKPVVVESESESEAANVACEVCKSDGDADKMLLCDYPTCQNPGYHIFCLKPKLTSIPEGDWFCPKHQPNIPCPNCSSKLHPLKVLKDQDCQRRGHPRKAPLRPVSYGCSKCKFYMCASCKNDMEALMPESEDEKSVEVFEPPVSSVSPVSSDDERIVFTRKPEAKRPPRKRKRQEPESKPIHRPAPPRPQFPKPRAPPPKPKLLKPRILRSIPKRPASVRPKIPVQDVRRHPQQRPVRHSESRNERRLKTQAHKIPSRKQNASFRSKNPHLFQYPPPLKNFFKQFPINTPEVIRNANIDNFFQQYPHLRAPEHTPPLPPLPIIKESNHIRKKIPPVPSSELQKQLAALSDLCHGHSSSSSDQNGDTSNSTISSNAAMTPITKHIDPPRMEPLNITSLKPPVLSDDAQSTVSMSISPVQPVAHSPMERKPMLRRSAIEDITKAFAECKTPKPMTRERAGRLREQHMVNLMRHGIHFSIDPEPEEPDREPGEIEIKKVVRFVLPGRDPEAPDVELGTLDDYLTPKEEIRYINRLIDEWSYRCLTENMPSSPAIDMGTRVDEPFFIWTKNEFFISGQPTSRVVVQVTIQTPENQSDSFKCKGTIMAAKQISRPLPSSVVLLPDFQISTKPSINQQLCFSQYLFKKQKRHMKLDVFIPKERRDEITEFVRCRPAVQALNFIRAPLDYQVWFVPVRQLQNNFLQCQVYFVDWDFFSKLCDKRYRLSIMKRKLNLVIQVEHFLADIIVDPSQPQRRDKKVKPKFEVKLKIERDQFLPLLEHFEITLISCHQQSMINEVVRQLGLERDQFLDEFHRRLFAGIPKNTEGLYSFAQYFEFYHFRRRRNTVMGIADPLEFVEEERDFILSKDTPNLFTRLREVQKEFFEEVTTLDDAKEISLQDILFKKKTEWA